MRNLRKFTNYSFTVRAVNEIGVGPPSVDDARNITSEDGKCAATLTVIVVFSMRFDLLTLRGKIEAANHRIGYKQYREGQQLFQNLAKPHFLRF